MLCPWHLRQIIQHRAWLSWNLPKHVFINLAQWLFYIIRQAWLGSARPKSPFMSPFEWRLELKDTCPFHQKLTNHIAGLLGHSSSNLVLHKAPYSKGQRPCKIHYNLRNLFCSAFFLSSLSKTITYLRIGGNIPKRIFLFCRLDRRSRFVEPDTSSPSSPRKNPTSLDVVYEDVRQHDW